MPVILAPPLEDMATTFVTAISADIRRLLVECTERLHHFVEADMRAARSGVTQGWSGVDRTRIRRPRGEDGSFFIEREVRVGDDLGWMREGLRWMKEFVEVEVEVGAIHGIPLIDTWHPRPLQTSGPIERFP